MRVSRRWQRQSIQVTGDASRTQTSCAPDRKVPGCVKGQRGCMMAGRLCYADSGRRCSLTARGYDILSDSERLLDLQPDCTSVLKLGHMSGSRVGGHVDGVVWPRGWGSSDTESV